MRKVGLFFGSMFAIVAAFALTSIAPASAVDIPAYEKSSPILSISTLLTAKRSCPPRHWWRPSVRT
ncbi:hypothetical protein HGG75_05010 [Ochrobactrum pseudogrignonense]|nr:hypothetical protein [Brucella pseudogrignonensis]